MDPSQPDHYKKYLQDDHYHDSSKLEARIELHRRYTPLEKNIWHKLWKEYDFSGVTDLLEVGCGTGAFWTDPSAKIPEGVTLTLSSLTLT